jgi:hypothetical protein
MTADKRSPKQPEPETQPGPKMRVKVWLGAGAFALAAVVFLLFRSKFQAYTFNMVACFLACGYLVMRRFIDDRTRFERAAFSLAFAILFVGVLFNNHHGQTDRLFNKLQIRTWNIYHYYLGSKYFNELGYKDLYTQTHLADREDTNRLKKTRHVRDLDDYRIKPIQQVLPSQKNPEWTDQRWKEFKADLRALLPKTSRNVWANMVRDRGYNPTPFWNTIGSALSYNYDITERAGMLSLTYIDLACYLVMFAAVVWAFGLEAAMLVLLAFALLPFNLHRVIAGYIQYDWMAAIVLGLCLIKKRSAIGSSVAFGYAVMAKMFPLFLVVGFAAPGIRKLVRNRKIDRFHLIFASVLLLFCIVGVFIGSIGDRGFHSWVEWKKNIGLHNYEMTFGEGRVGLKHIFTHPLGSDSMGNEHTRKKTLPKQMSYYVASSILLLALFLLAMAYRDDLNAVLLSMVLVFIFLVPSHYYWSILALLPLWNRNETEPDAPYRPALLPSLLAFVAPAGWYQYARVQNHQLAQYLRFDWILAIGFLILMAWLAYGTIRTLRATKGTPVK